MTDFSDHRAAIDTVGSTPRHILIVVANPATSTTTGWRVGFWAAELTHPYYEFTRAGYQVTIASPELAPWPAILTSESTWSPWSVVCKTAGCQSGKALNRSSM